MRTLLIATLAFGCVATAADDEKTATKKRPKAEQTVKTTEVKVVPRFPSPPLVLKVPETWTKEVNANSMRLATYATPAAGDGEKGELTVFSFPGGGGSVGQNLARWRDQFQADGRTVSVKKGKAGKAKSEYHIIELGGTFMKSVGPPIAGRKEAQAGSKMLGVILTLKEDGGDKAAGIYFLKLVGPAASIDAQAKNFRKSFGGKKASETAYEL